MSASTLTPSSPSCRPARCPALAPGPSKTSMSSHAGPTPANQREARLALYGHLSDMGAPAAHSYGPHSSSSLLTVAQLRAVPAARAEVGPPALASARRNSLRGYPSGVYR